MAVVLFRITHEVYTYESLHQPEHRSKSLITFIFPLTKATDDSIERVCWRRDYGYLPRCSPRECSGGWTGIIVISNNFSRSCLHILQQRIYTSDGSWCTSHVRSIGYLSSLSDLDEDEPSVLISRLDGSSINSNS